MSKFSQGNKPSRAERKALKKAARAAARGVEFDAHDQAKEESQAARATGSRWSFGRRKQEPDFDEPDEHGMAIVPERSELEPGGDPVSFAAPAPVVEPDPEPEPEEEPETGRLFGGFRRARRDPAPERRKEPKTSAPSERGTQIRPVQAKASDGARSASEPALSRTRQASSPVESFAALKKSVGSDGGALAGNVNVDAKGVLILDDPIVEARSAGAAQSAPGAEFSENWIGLWVSEDGLAIYIEEDQDDWYAVTVLPDPTTTCYSGPDYPEIQSYRMPAHFAEEEIGDFIGGRLTVITVPGLPDTHRSPVMHIYVLTTVPAAEGGGNRFATIDDPNRRVFIVADFETGTVNPWSDDDDIDWIDPSVNYYKAPGKLDAYMARRMSTDDPLN